MSCDCSSGSGYDGGYGNGYNGLCNADTPYPSVSSESVPSLINNLTYALYGQIQKNVTNGQVTWTIPCDPNSTATINGIPRVAGEGLLCYIIRALNLSTPSGFVTVNGAQTLTNKTLTAPVINNAPITATGSTTARTLENRFADVVNVKDFGAVGDGVTDDTAAFQNAAILAGTGNPIFVPSGNYLKSTITNEENYFWICDKALNSSGTNPISLIGHVEQIFANRRLMTKTTTTPNEFTEFQINKTFNYSGGTVGNVSSAQNVITTISKNVTNFVWGIVSVLNNSADAGENVAIYGQGNRVANTGPVWGGVFEAKDLTNTDSTGKLGTVGIEVDVFANGADVNNNRVGVDIAVGKGVSGGVAPVATAGVRIAPTNNNIANGTWNFGFQALGCVSADFLAQSASYAAFQGNGNNTFGVVLSGTHAVGFDTTIATITNKAIRIAAGQQIAFTSGGAITMEYDTASGSILFKNAGVTKQALSMGTEGIVNNGVPWIVGAGSPEGNVTAPIASLYTNTTGGVSTTLYVKTSGTGNTGWTAK